MAVVDGPGLAPRNFFQFKDVRVRGLTKEDIVERIPKDSEVIALGCMFTSNWVYVREIVKDVRAQFPNAKLIMGGEHVTGFPELSLKQAPWTLSFWAKARKSSSNCSNIWKREPRWKDWRE